MRTTIAYCRVSTETQSFDSQKAEIERYIEYKRIKNVEWVFDTISGTKSSRPGLDALMKRIRKREVETVIVYQLSRMFRSTSGMALTLAEMDKAQTTFVSVFDGIDTTDSSPAAVFQRTVLSAVAELERSLIVERTKAGKALMKKKGIKDGRPVTITNVDKTKVFELYKQLLSYREIAKKLKISHTSVMRIVREQSQKTQA